jgi:hypothetical protein
VIQEINCLVGLHLLAKAEAIAVAPVLLLQELLGVARRRGWRLNLRPLAEVQTLAWLVGLFLFSRWLWALASSPGGLFALDDEYYAELAAGQQEQQQQYAGVGAGGYQHQHHAVHRPQQPHWQ